MTKLRDQLVETLLDGLCSPQVRYSSMKMYDAQYLADLVLALFTEEYGVRYRNGMIVRVGKEPLAGDGAMAALVALGAREIVHLVSPWVETP